MICNAKNGTLPLDGTDMDYIRFGSGGETLVVVPGLGDGLKTVRGAALPFAVMYRAFAKRYTVYTFSRKNQLEEGCSTRDMARDLKTAMDALGLDGAHVLGVSQGGMIAQHLAVDFPGAVKKLVLAVTAARPTEPLRAVVGNWIRLAGAGDYRGLLIDTAERSYSERRLRTYRPLYPVLTRIGKPRDFGRFILQARACLGHDCYGSLDKITCPTLVIGGGRDRIVGPEASVELAGRIGSAGLYLYGELGHAAYEEAKDFNSRVLDFFGSAL